MFCQGTAHSWHNIFIYSLQCNSLLSYEKEICDRTNHAKGKTINGQQRCRPACISCQTDLCSLIPNTKNSLKVSNKQTMNKQHQNHRSSRNHREPEIYFAGQIFTPQSSPYILLLLKQTRQQYEGQLNPPPPNSFVSLSGGIFGSETECLALTTVHRRV